VTSAADNRNPIAVEIREDWQFEYMDAKNLQDEGWLGGQAQASNVGSEARGSNVRARSSGPQAFEVPANALDAVDGGAVQVSKPLSGAMDPAGIAAAEKAFVQKHGFTRNEAIDYTRGRFLESARAGDFEVMARMFDAEFRF
jgi:hypothetical protein